MNEIYELRSQLEDPDYGFSQALAYASRVLIACKGGVSEEELKLRMASIGISQDMADEVVDCIRGF